MWSKAAIQHKTGILAESLKVILPAVSYFWTNGPWRMIWTKFGVDPRYDFNMRIYQTLDFRIRARGSQKHFLMTIDQIYSIIKKFSSYLSHVRC